jgi:aspartyl/asparaginyl beta-hydroxylase (cupin superfamily)
VHIDGDGNQYMARIHIPLITNKKCVFISEGQNLHMEAGKAYAVWVNNWHQIRNGSDEDRFHIICDFYDTKGITKEFSYRGNIQELEDHAKMMRQNIDAAVISPEEYERFEAVRQSFVTKPKHENNGA